MKETIYNVEVTYIPADDPYLAHEMLITGAQEAACGEFCRRDTPRGCRHAVTTILGVPTRRAYLALRRRLDARGWTYRDLPPGRIVSTSGDDRFIADSAH